MRGVTAGGEILHLLAAVLQPIRDNGQLLPELDSSVQERFLEAWITAFNPAASSIISRTAVTPADDCAGIVIFMTRLLHFDLGIPGAWTKQLQQYGHAMCSSLFDLSIVCYRCFHPLRPDADHKVALRHRSIERSGCIRYAH